MTYYNLKLEKDGTFSGQISESRPNGYSAYNFRYGTDSIKNTQTLAGYSGNNQHPGLFIDSFKIGGLQNPEKGITEIRRVKIRNQAKEEGNQLTFNPLFFERMTENPLKTDHRLYPVDFIYPRSLKMIFHISIPEGYEIDKLPANQVFSTQSKGRSLFLFSR